MNIRVNINNEKCAPGDREPLQSDVSHWPGPAAKCPFALSNEAFFFGMVCDNQIRSSYNDHTRWSLCVIHDRIRRTCMMIIHDKQMQWSYMVRSSYLMPLPWLVVGRKSDGQNFSPPKDMLALKTMRNNRSPFIASTFQIRWFHDFSLLAAHQLVCYYFHCKIPSIFIDSTLLCTYLHRHVNSHSLSTRWQHRNCFIVYIILWN